MKKDFLDQFRQKPIGIFGGGASGIAVRKLLGSVGIDSIIFDEKAGHGDSIEFGRQEAESVSLLINSPGFPPSHPWFAEAKKNELEVWSEIELASKFWKGKIFLVTGTNGKSTITQMLTAALLANGLEAYAFGNIGTPFSEFWKYQPGDDAYAVLEISSFQAWNLKLPRADGIIWTNFAEDHLDWHHDLRDYFDAKWNVLCQVEDGPIVIGESILDHARTYERVIPMVADVLSENISRFSSSLSVSRINQLNMEFVRKFLIAEGLEHHLLDQMVSNFSFLPHRLEKTAVIEGVHYWNDSKATNFHAVESALENFYEPIIWIGGGLPKGGEIEDFVARIAPKIRVAIVFGMVSERLSAAFTECGVLNYQVQNIEDIQPILRMEAIPGDNVVLSPGFASFDQFNGYADRGETFCQIIRNIAPNHSPIDPVGINN